MEDVKEPVRENFLETMRNTVSILVLMEDVKEQDVLILYLI